MSARGQATVEYVGLIALVAALLVAGGIAALRPAVAEWVVEGFRRALCAVTGAACEPGRRPCVVASEEVRERGEFTTRVIRVGRDHAVLRERRSDGSVLVTVIDGLDAGVQAGGGKEVALRVDRHELGAGGALRGALIAEGGGGRTWLARDAREAEAIVEAIGSDGRLRWLTAPYRAVGGVLGLREEPEPAEVYLEGGVRGRGTAEGSLPGVDGQLEAVVAGAHGVRWNRRRGEATFYLGRSGGLAGALASVLGDVGGGVRGDGRLALTLDRRGRLLRLTALAAYEHPDGRDRGRRTELESTLDLRDPARAAAVRALLPALATRAGRAVALPALLARVRAEGRTDRRVYATARDEAGLGGRLTAAGGLGAQALRSTTATRLLDAASRSPAGPWLRRDDCLAGR